MSGYDSTLGDERPPQLNKDVPEDFVLGGKIVTASRLYGDRPLGKRLPDPATLPGSAAANATDWAPNGRLLAVGSQGSPYLFVYKYDGDTLTKMADPGSIPPGAVQSVSFSPNGKYLGVGYGASPYFSVYTVNETTGSLFKIPDAPVIAASTANGIKFSPDSKHVAVATSGGGSGSSTPNIRVYSVVGTVLTKIADPVSLAGGGMWSVDWTPDGRVIAVAGTNSPTVSFYEFDGETLTKLADPVAFPTGTITHLKYSPDGKYLAMSGGTTPFVSVYSVKHNTYVKLANPSPLPAAACYGVEWSPDGRYLMVSQSASPWIIAYRFNGRFRGSLEAPVVLPPSQGNRGTFSPDGKIFALANSGNPTLNVYQSLPGNPASGPMLDLGRLSASRR